MLGRAIDQILRHASKRQLYEPHVDCAIAYGRSEQAPRGPQSASQINRPPPAAWTCSDLPYVRLAEEANGPIPRHVDPAYVWGEALAALRDRRPAACIINLETAITTSSDPWPKAINYPMHPANVECLTAAEVDCCVLANNHVLYWGKPVCSKPWTRCGAAKSGRPTLVRRRKRRRHPQCCRSAKAGERSSTASARPRVASPATGLPPLSARGDLAVMYLPEFDTTDYRFLSLDMVPMQMRRFLDDGLPDLGVHVRRRDATRTSAR